MTTSERPGIPASFATLGPDVHTAPFWEATRRHVLVAPRCLRCGAFHLPPAGFCWNCQSQELEFVPLSGEGTVYSFTIARHPAVPQLREVVPYVIAVIALDGAPGARLVSNIVGADVDEVRIGQRVRVVWEDISEVLTVPRFEPVPDHGGAH